MAKELARRLNTTPSRDIFPQNYSRPRRSELLDKALVCDDTAIEVDFCARAMSAFIFITCESCHMGVLRYPSSAAQNAAIMAMHPARLNSSTLRHILISSAFDRIKGPPPFEGCIWSSVVVVRSTNSTPCFPCCCSIIAISVNGSRYFDVQGRAAMIL